MGEGGAPVRVHIAELKSASCSQPRLWLLVSAYSAEHIKIFVADTSHALAIFDAPPNATELEFEVPSSPGPLTLDVHATNTATL